MSLQVVDDKPFEVWVTSEQLHSECRARGIIHLRDFHSWRLNARFGERGRADAEVDWYNAHGYYGEVRIVGCFTDDDPYEGDGALEYPEGSGG